MAKTNFKSADSILSVSLRKNQFKPDTNSFIGRVTRNTVTLENLIAEISEKNEGVSAYMIQHVADLLRDAMLKACKGGNAVDVLGLGTLYISVAGSVNGDNPGESSIPGFRLNFTPSSRAQETLESIKVDKVIIASSEPVIDKIINTFNQNEERNLIKGKGVKITGSKLKIAGVGSGLWFAPLDDNGNAVKDESSWIAVNQDTVSCNKPKSLEFYVPDSLSESDYRIVIRTRYSPGDKELKNPLTTVSRPVSVAA